MSVVLCILDGWGLGEKNEYNAIHLGNTPNFDMLMKNHPNSKLTNNGEAVGLPNGQMGNSEVGHLTIGSGRVIYQDLPRISKAIESGEFEHNKVIQNILSSNKTTHIIGLISDGGVHSHINHIISLYKILSSKGIKVHVHAITDGRDVSPQSAKNYTKELEKNGIVPATLMGRFYAMDRDKRTERTQAAFDAIAFANGEQFTSINESIDSSYLNNINDEFIKPLVNSSYNGIQEGENIIITNFRADRVRQISDILINNKSSLKYNILSSMTEYSNELSENMDVIFTKEQPKNTLGEVISNNSLNQLRIAETEKYAHVTYFFNGGREAVFQREDRILVPSPKVATYDLMPEMSAYEVSQKLNDAIRSKKYQFICVNFANPDMVGHSGNIEATVKAIESVDICLGDIIQSCSETKTDLLVTADHGNAEEMINKQTGEKLTSHTMNLVPFIYFGDKNIKLNDGSLCDIAPTVLSILRIEVPADMTGKKLTA